MKITSLDNRPVFKEVLNNRTELYAYPQSTKLSTCVDVDCLHIQTLLLFCELPFTLIEHSEPNFSPSHRLPCLYVKSNIYAGDDIAKYALEKGLNIDSELGENTSVCMAFSTFVQSKLKFALEYELWYVPQHFNKITSAFRGSNYCWPLNYFIPQRERNEKIKELLAQQPVLQTTKVIIV